MHKYFWSMYGMIINYSYTLTVLNVWSINPNTGINIHKYKYKHQNIKLVFDTLFIQVKQVIVHDKFLTLICM